MTFLELVKKRRSRRKYASQPVPREVIDRCVEAARLAPSACNAQPWAFIVVDDRALIEQIADRALSGIYAINMFAKKAPVLVVVITERSAYIAQMGGYFRGVQYSLIDIGIAVEHMILQAEEEGLGTCWLGWFAEDIVKKILNIPKEKRIDVVITMGYPEEGGLKEKPRKPIDTIRKFNKA